MTTVVNIDDDVSIAALRGDDEPETDGIIIRTPSDATLRTVLDEWSKSNSTVSVHVDKIEVNLEDTEDQTIRFGEHEVPSTEQGLEALARAMDMPVKYLLNIPADEQQFIFTHRLNRAADEYLVFEYTSNGVESIVKSSKNIIAPRQIAMALVDHMPIESPVRDFWVNSSDLRIDAYLPADWDGPEIGGDPKVGDITHGGIRVFQNRKQNLAPGCRSYTYRLVCTNGMEIMHQGIRVDARNKDEFEVLESFGHAIAETMTHLESDIRHFYAMREQKITKDATGTFRRVAQDAGLSDRTVGRLEDQLASIEGDPSMFDFSNLITNLANGAPESNMARTLQQAGGSLVADHTARCNSCHQRL